MCDINVIHPNMCLNHQPLSFLFNAGMSSNTNGGDQFFILFFVVLLLIHISDCICMFYFSFSFLVFI
jgi:hypothetical protein